MKRGVIQAQLRSLFLSGCVLGLSACAFITTPPPSEPGVANPKAWAMHKSELAKFDHWSLQGRAATGKILGWTGNLSWRERGDHFDVRMSGPVGVGGFRAKGTLESVEIRSEGQTFVTDDPEALVAKLLGWEFPLEGLRFWILGLPAPDVAAQITVDEQGHLVDLIQSGWRLAYTAYEQTTGPDLPRRIILDNGDNKIKMVIDRWFDLPKPEPD